MRKRNREVFQEAELPRSSKMLVTEILFKYYETEIDRFLKIRQIVLRCTTEVWTQSDVRLDKRLRNTVEDIKTFTRKKKNPLHELFYFRQKFEGLLRINQDFNNLWVYADSAAHPLQVKIILQFPALCPKTAVKTNSKTIYIENIIVPIFFSLQNSLAKTLNCPNRQKDQSVTELWRPR